MLPTEAALRGRVAWPVKSVAYAVACCCRAQKEVVTFDKFVSIIPPLSIICTLKANFEPFRIGSSGLVAGLCWAVLGTRVEATLTAL